MCIAHRGLFTTQLNLDDTSSTYYFESKKKFFCCFMYACFFNSKCTEIIIVYYEDYKINLQFTIYLLLSKILERQQH